eukprot:TRINITY_DN39560_c0_g1_i1.p1 TRINITY_DN39560_c0_g1~~TRINITY_DN39560_c0_g1_i1.p1  ORF type:complete len:189 (+),score=45.07 TRINITY_DN39560_c0_g1_i1:199-765(+)
MSSDNADQDRKEMLVAVQDVLAEFDVPSSIEDFVRQRIKEKMGASLDSEGLEAILKEEVATFLANYVKARTGEVEEKRGGGGEEVEEQRDTATAKRKAEASAIVEEARRSKSTTTISKNGDRVICELSNTRRVTVSEFRGKPLVSVREYYEKNGEFLPTAKGISLSREQWNSLVEGKAAVEGAIQSIS